MKRFVLNLLLFGGIWFVLSFVCDLLVTDLIKKSKARSIVVWEDIFNSRIDADIIYLGSSRTCDHYNPRVIDSILEIKSYNLGLHAKNIDMDFLRWKLYNKYNNKKPQIIIWDVFYNSMTYSGQVADYRFAPYIFDDDVWNVMYNSRHDYIIPDKIIPLLRYWRHSQVLNYIFKPVNYDEKNPYNGYVGKDIPWSPHKTLRDLVGGGITYEYNLELVSQFRETIRNMQKDNITVVLVHSPFYFEGQEKIDGLQSIIDSLQTIAKEENCLFLNYANSNLCYDSILFANSLHMNIEGSAVFSAELAHTIDSLGLLKNTGK